MARPIWKGHISFGLVSVPVELYSAEVRADVSFHLVDSRNSARVRYERVNSETGEEVPWDKIVKGYEYSDGSYVLLSDEELERAERRNDAHDRDRAVRRRRGDRRPLFRTAVPGRPRQGRRKRLRAAPRSRRAAKGKAGIATIVIRARQHLAALLVHGDVLILELLRYPAGAARRQPTTTSPPAPAQIQG